VKSKKLKAKKPKTKKPRYCGFFLTICIYEGGSEKNFGWCFVYGLKNKIGGTKDGK